MSTDKEKLTESSTREKDLSFKRFKPLWVEKSLQKSPSFDKVEHHVFDFDDDQIWNVAQQIKKGEMKEASLILVYDPKNVDSFRKSLEPLLLFMDKFKKVVGLIYSIPISLTFVATEISPVQAGFRGFFKSLKKECPLWSIKIITFSDKVTKEGMASIAADEVMDLDSYDVLYREGKRFVPSIEEASTPVKSFLDNNVIIAVGGAKGVTFSLLKDVKGSSKLHIVGRSDPNSQKIKESVELLSSTCSHVEYHQGDATDESFMEEVFNVVKKKHGRIDFIINGAGVDRSRFLAHKKRGEIEEEFVSKAFSTYAILKLAKKYDVKKTIVFSSVVGLFGNKGQTVYAAANQFITGLVKNHNANSGCAMVIHWPPWDKVGMTAHPQVYEHVKRMGVSLIPPEIASCLFTQDLFGNCEEVVYLGENAERTSQEEYHAYSSNLYNGMEVLEPE